MKRSKLTMGSPVVSLLGLVMMSQHHPSSSYSLERRGATLESWILSPPSSSISDARAINENAFGSSLSSTSASQSPPLGKKSG